MWGLNKSWGNLVWLPWLGFLLSDWKVWHVYTVAVLVWLSGLAWYFPQIFLLLCLQRNFPHSCLIVLGDFYYLLYFFWDEIYWFFSVMVHLSSNKTPNDISGDVLNIWVKWICLACLLRPGSCSVDVRDNSIVLPYGILATMSF